MSMYTVVYTDALTGREHPVATLDHNVSLECATRRAMQAAWYPGRAPWPGPTRATVYRSDIEVLEFTEGGMVNLLDAASGPVLDALMAARVSLEAYYQVED
jgi:hypothetical protein